MGDSSSTIDRLGFIQRRKLGLTIVSVRRILKDLRESGEFEDNTDVATLSVMVATILVEENTDAYKVAAGADWQAFFEAVIAFLEKFPGTSRAGPGRQGQ